MTRLFLDYLRYAEPLRDFYPHRPLSTDWHLSELEQIDAGYTPERRAIVANILERQNRAFGASQQTLDSIERLRNGAYAFVTGQQVGLFGGPMFSIYKALTAIKLAQTMTAQGHDAVPVFWLATEDHDLAEVNHVVLPDDTGRLHTLQTESSGAEQQPAGTVALAADLQALIQQARELLGDSGAVDALNAAYQPKDGNTLGAAFAKFYAKLFAKHGIILLDSTGPELHRVAAPVLVAAADRAAELNRALLERNVELESRGYHAQVKVTNTSTLLFQVKERHRDVVHRTNGHFRAGKEQWAGNEFVRRVAENPGGYSPNVLLRPVVQDYLLPTIAYIGGPAEIAYFAQVAVVYERLAGRTTPILPRFSATIIEPRQQRLLESHRLKFFDVMAHAHQFGDWLADRELPREVDAQFGASLEKVEVEVQRLTASLGRLDPTLVRAAERAGAKMKYQLNRLRGRTGKALLRRDADLARHASQLAGHLYPHEGLQERTIGAAYYAGRYGEGLLEDLLAQIEPTCGDHQLLI